MTEPNQRSNLAKAIMMLTKKLGSTVAVLSLALLGNACTGDLSGADGDNGGGASEHAALRRLTNVEYDRTVSDLLGFSTTPSVEFVFPPDPALGGFRNNAQGLTLSATHAQRYRDAAESLARAAVQSAAFRDNVLRCNGDSGDVCLQRFVREFGKRAFRRPLEEEEVQSLLALAAEFAPPGTGGTGEQISNAEAENLGGCDENPEPGFANLCDTREVASTINVPATGDYILSARAFGVQGGPETVSMEFRIDGQAVATFAVTADGNAPEIYSTTSSLSSGSHSFAVAFTNDYHQPPVIRDLYLDWFSVDSPNGDIPTGGVQVAIEAMLQAPSFLFRVEVGEYDKKKKRNKLVGAELATRLSYLFLGTTPSSELLDAAFAGELDTAEGIADRAEQMLASQASKEWLQDFYMQWLRMEPMMNVQLPTEKYPEWNEDLRMSLFTETQLLTEHFLFDADADILDLLTANFSFIDKTIADYYGLSAPANDWDKVEFASDSPRGGLLTQAGMQAAITRGAVTAAPIRRGLYVREAWLCKPAPPLPDNIPAPPTQEELPGASLRDRLAQHRIPGCVECHQVFEPMGFGMERFDLDGAYREEDEFGNLLTGEGEIYSDQGTLVSRFIGTKELASLLREQPETTECVVRNAFRYALGRVEIDKDSPALQSLTEQFVDDNRNFTKLLFELVQSDAFRYAKASK